jgi:hypothetical protein
MDLGKGGSARLLVNGHDLTAEERIDEGGFAGIEITGNKDLGGGVLHTETELVDVCDGRGKALVQKMGNGRFFELGHEGRGGVGRGRAAELEVEAEDVEIGRERRGVGRRLLGLLRGV